MPNNNELSVVILNYNTKTLLKKSLETLFNSLREVYGVRVIVVDNASTDDSVNWLKENYPQVEVIKNSKNLGFAAGNNVALKKCQSAFILLLNPDTELSVETVKIMLDYMKKNPEVGVSTCRINLKNGLLDDACHRGFPTPWNAFCHFSGLGRIFPQSKLFNGYHLGYQNLNKIHEIDACCGAFMFVRKEVGRKLNWFDEDYYWYGEDLDFCYRIKQTGAKIIYNPQTSILHWKGAASGMKKASEKITTADDATKKRAVLASIEAMKIFYQKHYVKKYPKFLNRLVMIGINFLEQRRLSKLKI